jgi:hypothetical protein
MARQEIASRQDRDTAWKPILEKVLGHSGLTIEERAAAALLVIAHQDSLDAGETLADLRTVLDRGLAGLHEKGQIERSQAGEYRLKQGKPSRTPMAVDAEPETPREEAAPSEETDRPVIA